MVLLRHLAALRPGPLASTTASAKTSLRAISRRWLALNTEVRDRDAGLDQTTQQLAPDMVQAHGVSTGTAAEMLILIGDNPERICSEAALAKLCGACPILASSGKTTRYRLNRGSNWQANAALYHVSPSACEPISRPSTTSGGAPPRERASRRSSDVSSAT
jgi:hypothetical protein